MSKVNVLKFYKPKVSDKMAQAKSAKSAEGADLSGSTLFAIF